MRSISDELRGTVNEARERLLQMSDDATTQKPTPGKWSKKEVLGHLIDSAANNHQRIVRACSDSAAEFPPYVQTEWVESQRYNERPWSALVALWFSYNIHLVHVIDCIPNSAATAQCNIGGEGTVALEFVVQDYVRHLRHHLTDILDRRA